MMCHEVCHYMCQFLCHCLSPCTLFSILCAIYYTVPFCFTLDMQIGIIHPPVSHLMGHLVLCNFNDSQNGKQDGEIDQMAR